MKTLATQLRNLQERLGVRQEVIAGIAVAALALGAVSFTLTTRVGTPAGAALAYMAAVDRADTDYVWSHSIIDSASTAPATISFVNLVGLMAQLKTSAHSRSGFDVQSVGYVTSGTKVVVTYDTSSGRASTSLVMRGGVPHSWPVLLEPAGLEIHLPTGAGAVAIDGQSIDSATGDIKIAVLSGHHVLSIAASRLFEAYTGDVEAQDQLPSFARADISKVKLTDEAVADAKQATTKAIQNCAGATVLKPDGCPQALIGDLTSRGVTWTVLGDPLADAFIRLDDQSDFQVTGHYLMRLSYDSSYAHGIRAIAVGGPYVATLKWDGQAMSVTGFESDAAATAVSQPSATDAQVLAALKHQFDSCLTLQAGGSDSCPQRVAAFDASNFVWHANGDPLRGAAVAWDSKQGFYRVTGTFDFSVDYDSTPPLSPTRHYQDHSSGPYTADLYWDGSKVVFVGFE